MSAQLRRQIRKLILELTAKERKELDAKIRKDGIKPVRVAPDGRKKEEEPQEEIDGEGLPFDGRSVEEDSVPNSRGNAARVGGNATNMIFKGIYNFKAETFIGEEGSIPDDSTDMIAKVAHGVKLPRGEFGKESRELAELIEGDFVDVEVGIGPGKRIMIGCTTQREFTQRARRGRRPEWRLTGSMRDQGSEHPLVFRMNGNMNGDLYQELIEQNIIVPNYQMAEGLGWVRLEGPRNSRTDDEIAERLQRFQGRGEGMMAFANPEYFVRGGGTPIGKDLLEKFWDRYAFEGIGDQYYVRIGGNLAVLVRSKKAEVKEAIFWTDKGQKTLDGNKFTWASTNVESLVYSLKYQLLTEASDDPFVSKEIPLIGDVLPDSQPLISRPQGRNWLCWGWEWGQPGWKWDDGLRVALTEEVKSLLGT